MKAVAFLLPLLWSVIAFAGRPCTLDSRPDGRLRLTVLTQEDGRDPNADGHWTARPGSFFYYRNDVPSYWQILRLGKDSSGLSLTGELTHYQDWQIISFNLFQYPDGHVNVKYTLRTPVGQPDLYFDLSGRSLPVLLVTQPEIRVLLNEALRGFGSGPYQFGSFVDAQLDASHPLWEEAASAMPEVEELLASHPLTWKDRERVGRSLRALGPAAAFYLFARGSEGLDPSTNLTVASVLADYPVIRPEDRKMFERFARPGQGYVFSE